jgi:hypothetical protein
MEVASFVTETPPRKKPQSNLLSTIFAVAAVLFAILAVVLYVRDSSRVGIAPVPTAAPGGNQIVNVTDALRAQGLTVEQPPRLFVPAGALRTPGQGVLINGSPAFIFLFPDKAAAQSAAQSTDPDHIIPARLAGTPAPSGERRLVQGSNVIVVLIDGTDDTWQKVQSVVSQLP